MSYHEVCSIHKEYNALARLGFFETWLQILFYSAFLLLRVCVSRNHTHFARRHPNRLEKHPIPINTLD